MNRLEKNMDCVEGVGFPISADVDGDGDGAGDAGRAGVPGISGGESRGDAGRVAPVREASLTRVTSETSIQCTVSLDNLEEPSVIQTGIGFLDHMLHALARHGRFRLQLVCTGDLDVDDHHTVEDCGLVLGKALSDSLGTRRNFARFGWAMAPMDEALARAVVDVSGRPWAVVKLGLEREKLGTLSCENLTHFFRTLAVAMGACIHVEVLYGENDHHRAEAGFKALALALRQALAVADLGGTGAVGCGIPSTKGVL